MKTEIILMTVFATLAIGITRFETNQSSKNSLDLLMPQEVFLPMENDSQLAIENGSVLTNDQYFNALIIVEVLSNYNAEKMEKAIDLTYDENVLDYKNAFIIMNEMSDLIKALRNADSAEVIFEDQDIISLKVKKRKKNFQLDIHFKAYSEKIEKMEFVEMK